MILPHRGRLAVIKKGTTEAALPHIGHLTHGYNFLHKTEAADINRLQPPDKFACQPLGQRLRLSAGGVFVADIYQSIEAEIPRLRRYARALARDVAAADDLVQDCLARALGKLHLWQDGTDLRAWLFTILHNQYVNQVRRSVREGAAVGLSETEPLLTRAPHQGKRLELRDLERAIRKLPEEQRAVILLVGLEGMRYEEVAEVLGVPVGTVRSRLSRGRDALRRLMGVVPDRHAEIIMADPAALRRALQRFPARAANGERHGAAAQYPARGATKPMRAAGTVLN
jgi:RNA polymerase sigma-70 factor (ECF subfamily)